ncbi:IKS protein kinase [Fonticula alba]|uniref:non-specific serine/threonine protein kinase n=1 Tax=Fonticula alba TaxID=691883 RepID=A0A058ZAY4_FONAL|nr:IKS protein kinase [Fonticula alba]KCV70587.1 IKS protein kinase [Fonticula alba]|eukprot:XP_009495103.1 IKS protein kinase [Fonticula alba]
MAALPPHEELPAGPGSEEPGDRTVLAVHQHPEPPAMGLPAVDWDLILCDPSTQHLVEFHPPSRSVAWRQEGHSPPPASETAGSPMAATGSPAVALLPGPTSPRTPATGPSNPGSDSEAFSLVSEALSSCASSAGEEDDSAEDPFSPGSGVVTDWDLDFGLDSGLDSGLSSAAPGSPMALDVAGSPGLPTDLAPWPAPVPLPRLPPLGTLSPLLTPVSVSPEGSIPPAAVPYLSRSASRQSLVLGMASAVAPFAGGGGGGGGGGSTAPVTASMPLLAPPIPERAVLLLPGPAGGDFPASGSDLEGGVLRAGLVPGPALATRLLAGPAVSAADMAPAMSAPCLDRRLILATTRYMSPDYFSALEDARQIVQMPADRRQLVVRPRSGSLSGSPDGGAVSRLGRRASLHGVPDAGPDHRPRAALPSPPHRLMLTSSAAGPLAATATGTRRLFMRLASPEAPADVPPEAIPPPVLLPMIPGYYRQFFREHGRLGSGATGTVHLVEHCLHTARLGLYACKQAPFGWGTGAAERLLSARLREVLTLVHLGRHRNVVEYKHAWVEPWHGGALATGRSPGGPPAATGQDPGVPTLFILMQYCEAGSLEDRLLERRPTVADAVEERRRRARERRASTPAAAPAAGSSSAGGPGTASAGSAPGPASVPACPPTTARLSEAEADSLADALDRAVHAALGPGILPADRRVRLPREASVWHLLGDIAAGLEHLHYSGVLHCDVKPSNVLLTERGGGVSQLRTAPARGACSAPATSVATHLQMTPAERVRRLGDLRGLTALLSDFGEATPLSELLSRADPGPPAAMVSGDSPGASPTHSVPLVGTLDYLAPELLVRDADSTASGPGGSGPQHSPATDVWSLGMLLFWLLFGGLPFDGNPAPGSPPAPRVLDRLSLRLALAGLMRVLAEADDLAPLLGGRASGGDVASLAAKAAAEPGALDAHFGQGVLAFAQSELAHSHALLRLPSAEGILRGLEAGACAGCDAARRDPALDALDAGLLLGRARRTGPAAGSSAPCPPGWSPCGAGPAACPVALWRQRVADVIARLAGARRAYFAELGRFSAEHAARLGPEGDTGSGYLPLVPTAPAHPEASASSAADSTIAPGAAATGAAGAAAATAEMPGLVLLSLLFSTLRLQPEKRPSLAEARRLWIEPALAACRDFAAGGEAGRRAELRPLARSPSAEEAARAEAAAVARVRGSTDLSQDDSADQLPDWHGADIDEEPGPGPVIHDHGHPQSDGADGVPRPKRHLHSWPAPARSAEAHALPTAQALDHPRIRRARVVSVASLGHPGGLAAYMGFLGLFYLVAPLLASLARLLAVHHQLVSANVDLEQRARAVAQQAAHLKRPLEALLLGRRDLLQQADQLAAAVAELLIARHGTKERLALVLDRLEDLAQALRHDFNADASGAPLKSTPPRDSSPFIRHTHSLLQQLLRPVEPLVESALGLKLEALQVLMRQQHFPPLASIARRLVRLMEARPPPALASRASIHSSASALHVIDHMRRELAELSGPSASGEALLAQLHSTPPSHLAQEGWRPDSLRRVVKALDWDAVQQDLRALDAMVTLGPGGHPAMVSGPDTALPGVHAAGLLAGAILLLLLLELLWLRTARRLVCRAVPACATDASSNHAGSMPAPSDSAHGFAEAPGRDSVPGPNRPRDSNSAAAPGESRSTATGSSTDTAPNGQTIVQRRRPMGLRWSGPALEPDQSPGPTVCAALTGVLVDGFHRRIEPALRRARAAGHERLADPGFLGILALVLVAGYWMFWRSLDQALRSLDGGAGSSGFEATAAVMTLGLLAMHIGALFLSSPA